MYTLIKRLTVRELLVVQTPTIAMSLAIAEVFYKFGSFALEALAFLVTWFVLDAFGSVAFGKRRTNDLGSKQW